MFDAMTDELFAKADVAKAGNEWLWEQCRDILSATMARVSTLGMSLARVEIFEEQKKSLLDDLAHYKNTGKLPSK